VVRIRNYILNGNATIGNWSFNGQYTAMARPFSARLAARGVLAGRL